MLIKIEKPVHTPYKSVILNTLHMTHMVELPNGECVIYYPNGTNFNIGKWNSEMLYKSMEREEKC